MTKRTICGTISESSPMTSGRKARQADGPLAQLVEHRVHIAGVTGSSPVRTTSKRAPPERAGLFLKWISNGKEPVIPAIAGAPEVSISPGTVRRRRKRTGGVVGFAAPGGCCRNKKSAAAPFFICRFKKSLVLAQAQTSLPAKTALASESKMVQKSGFQKIRESGRIIRGKKRMFQLSSVAFGNGLQDVL